MFKEGLKGLPDSIFEFQEMVIELQKQKERIENNNEFLKNENDFILEELRLLKLKMFTRISERYQDETDNLQRLLFSDISKDEEELKKEKQEDTVIKEHKRKKPGRRPIPEDLPRVEMLHDIPEKDKQCACGSKKSRIGEETCEKMQIEPAKIWVAKHIRPKYAWPRLLNTWIMVW
jgi:hypothetical protein